MQYKSVLFGLFATLSLISLGGCSTTTDATVTQKRQAVQTMNDKVLTELFALKPSVRSQINSAPGYAVFDNANVNLILASFGGGYGVVTDTQTGAQKAPSTGKTTSLIKLVRLLSTLAIIGAWLKPTPGGSNQPS